MTDYKIGSAYLHHLQDIYHHISRRGIRVDMDLIEKAKLEVDSEIKLLCRLASAQWSIFVYVGAENDPGKLVSSVNINASSGEKTLLKCLQSLGYNVPKITSRNEEGDYEQKFSTNELTLQKILSANQFGFKDGDPAIKAVLRIRELGKLRSSYLNAAYYKKRDGHFYYLSSYNVGGTLSGRRSSKQHTLGYGNNAQNFPKHGTSAKVYRECLVPAIGNIFLFVDQKAAEEWPVQALAQNETALNEMRLGVNRHIKRAAAIFQKPEDSLTEREWKDDIMYYLGKKTGHANNYGMQPTRMSDSLAQEGISKSVADCRGFLDQINILEPNTKGVFHAYVKEQLRTTRTLKTPFGRERNFLGVRPNDINPKIENEAYSYIPQSTVGDNNGFACFDMETDSTYMGDINHENHDSLTLDIPATVEAIQDRAIRLEKAYDRTITMHNGISFNIPIEYELGFNFGATLKLKDYSTACITETLERLREGA
jgi:hypothetical protein